jgi:hypothetical protein
MERPSDLPEDFSLAAMMYLTGLTSRRRIEQLCDEGIFQRTERGRYRVASLPNYVAYVKAQDNGPKGWREARTRWMQKRAAVARA